MLKTDKAALSAALSSAGSIVKAKDKIPVLQNILIEPGADGQHLVARGGNMDMEIAATFAAAIGPDFQPFTCPAQSFAAFVAGAPDSTISIEAVNGDSGFSHVTLRSGKSRLKLPVLPADGFHRIDTEGSGHTVTLAGEILAKAFDAVSYAAETDVTRYYICGVLMQGDADGLNLVATNGKILSRRLIFKTSFDESVDASEFPVITIPTSTVDRVTKACKDADDVKIEVFEMRIRFTIGNVVMTSKLIDGTFPDWRRLIPANNDNRITVSNQALKGAITRVLIATPDSGNGVAFSFTEESLTLRAGDGAAGEGEDEIAIEADRAIAVGINGAFMQAILSHANSETIEILLADRMSPVLIKTPDDTAAFTVLMPMAHVKGVTM